ncbi:competence protein ComEC [Monaibacterium marinum]|uniref:Competence protein ComEC n=1 Tax=Pontivivens marinum TaxID=1690039 RepID=A0A2C9CTA5_9RHOB|nr:ComEC/Rec2 family competence protein [Monaibacterium marinum]SOH93609.1 competence protein ComEC [Monaibacterium marinum]
MLFGAGIGVYFALHQEPTWGLCILVLAIAALALLGFRGGLTAGTVALIIAIPCFGFVNATIRTEIVSHPVLERDFYGSISGRVIDIGRSSAGNPRVLLDNVTLYGGPQVARIRVSLTGDEVLPHHIAGRVVLLTARIGPPGRPVAPGGFDFRRLAWFDHLSAVGYTDMPVMVLEGQPSAPVFRARMILADGIRAGMQEPAAGFAAAILTGDRSTVDQEVLADLRASNLAHLLAISGLHMGLLTAFIFALVRRGLALIPGLALRYPVKKWGAVAAMLAGIGYLALSGASVPTQRAFVMVAVVLTAVLLDRPAFTLRGVALAAMLILLVRPESVLQAGFQLSFAATSALVAVFEKLRRYNWWRDEAKGWVSQYRPGIALLITSSVAGLATAPFGAFHFNQVSQLGLIANLMAVPLMGAVIMPAGVVAGVLALFGLQGAALWVMSFGIETVLGVAHWVAGLEGATRGVKAGPWYILPMIGLAGIWMILWRGRGIWLGPTLFAVALFLWQASSRPDLLISDSGRLIGAMTPQGRALNRSSGNTFAANNWLTDDGDPSDRPYAVARWQPRQGQGWQRVSLTNSWHLIAVTSRSRWPSDIPLCDAKTILIVAAWSGEVPLPDQTNECAQVWQRDALKQSGGLAYWLRPDGFTLQTVSDAEAQRPWVR